MALELASQATSDISRLLLWNPVSQGEQYILQFLRLRLVNSMMQGERKEKVSDLIELVERDGVIDVAGYELSKAMFSEVSGRKAQTLVTELNSSIDVLWLDIASQLKTLPVPTQKLLDQLGGAGHRVTIKQLAGPQFWATQEISRADTLITATCECLSSEPCQAQVCS
ncbi:esterase/lipase/thioesterase family [gamma proteobacterium IMCC2047]|nr:esterase/lipase/thioesterase family [gamma proteobacterium IMCC2047]